jgi:hypothetical protein
MSKTERAKQRMLRPIMLSFARPLSLALKSGYIAAVLTSIILPFGHALANETTTEVGPRMKVKIPVKPANPEEAPNFFKWRTRLSLVDWKNKDEHAQTAGVLLDAAVQKMFGDSLKFKSEVYASIRPGYSATRFGEVKPSSGVGIVEGLLEYSPFQQFGIQAGVLDQGNINAPTLVDSIPFPAVQETLKIGSEYSAEVSAEQAIATTTSLDTKTTGSEPTPGFFVEKMKLAVEPKNAVVSGNIFGGLWTFQNLPSAAAVDSDILGNTIVKVLGKPQYKYKFDGWLAGAQAKVQLGRYVNWEILGEMVQNTQAPDTYGGSQIIDTKMTIKLPRDIDLIPGGSAFYAESDSGPGVFNMTELGHNNRIGYVGNLALRFNKQGFKLAGYYVDSDLINPSALQTRQQYLLLKFETLYAFL